MYEKADVEALSYETAGVLRTKKTGRQKAHSTPMAIR